MLKRSSSRSSSSRRRHGGEADDGLTDESLVHKQLRPFSAMQRQRRRSYDVFSAATRPGPEEDLVRRATFQLRPRMQASLSCRCSE